MLDPARYQKELESRSTALVVIETTLFVCITATAIVGNLMVCWAVYRCTKLRTMSNIYIIALAIFDILMAILCMPLSIEVSIIPEYKHGDQVVQFQGFFTFFLSLASIQTMTAMAINRFFRIVKPSLYRKYFNSHKKILISLIVIVVLAGLGAGLPLLFNFAVYIFHYGKVFSYIRYLTNAAAYTYTVILKIFFITIPILITLLCYYNIFKVVQAHSRTMRINTNSSGPSMNVEEVNITKALFATVVGFVACWTPVAIIDMIDTFSNHTVNQPRQIYLMYIYLGYGSSSINPLIYGILNRSFREEFTKVFRLKCSKQSDVEREVSRGDHLSTIHRTNASTIVPVSN